MISPAQAAWAQRKLDAAVVRQAVEDLRGGEPLEALDAARWFLGEGQDEEEEYVFRFSLIRKRLGLGGWAWEDSFVD